jgi:hypothetical protein
MKTVVAILAVLSLANAGCAARSNTRIAASGQASNPSHNEPVCFIRAPLPSSIAYSVIGEIRGGKKWYGGFSEVLTAMANEARRIGADAVINLVTTMDANAIAFARPIGTGTAIKLKEKGSFDCQKNGGTPY